MVTIHQTLRRVHKLVVVEKGKCSFYTLRRVKKVACAIIIIIVIISIRTKSTNTEKQLTQRYSAEKKTAYLA